MTNDADPATESEPESEPEPEPPAKPEPEPEPESVPQPPQRTERRVRHDLRASSTDNAAWAAHIGCGESFIPAFILAMNAGQVAAGLVVTLPQIVGATLQLASPRAVRAVGSLKRWVVLCSAVQALSFIPFIIAAWIGACPTPLLFLIAAIYWTAGMAGGPAWSTWITTLVPVEVRARYFARRTRLGNLTLVSALIGAGAFLEYARGHGVEARAFIVLFAAAGLLRLISTAYLAVQSEYEPLPAAFRLVSPLEAVRRVRETPDGRLLLLLVSVSFAAQTAGPFFAPYMLEQIPAASYGNFVMLQATIYLARILSLPLWGMVASRFGADRVLLIGGIGIVPVAGLWAVSPELWYLIFLQALGGFVWAAYDLGALLTTLERIRDSERTSLLSAFNFANALAMTTGSLLGGWLLASLGADPAAYHTLFVVSTLVRILPLIILFKLVRAPRRENVIT